MGSSPRLLRWSLVAGLVVLALYGSDQAAGRETDLPLTVFLAVNGTLSLAGAWYLLARRSPWCAYWGPRLIAEIGHWVFDLFWIALFAFLSLLMVPLFAPVLVLVPPVTATALLVRRLRADLCPCEEPLRFWV